MQITIDLDDRRLEQALRLFEIAPAHRADAATAYGEIAADLFFEWLLNERRFETMSQATEHYVAKVEEKLYPDDPPNPTKLYERYSLPLARARYLARILLARRSARWREGARRELLAKLNEKRVDAEAAEAAGRLSQEFDCVLSRPAYDEFQVLYEWARANPVANRPLAPPRVISTFVQEVTVRIRCQVILVVIDILNQRGA
ncbi:hypothetical protein [Agrobacterium sp. NPDC090283]|uniref:hypothetical protein n=1 Tax=Agrobacterium sp. NPDC090283 TaxID=3363920 RepID=UPI00383BBE4A